MTLAAKPFAAAVNHLLARESWARERLAPYAGKTARLSCPPVVLMLLVQPDGYLGALGETDAQQFDVTISVPSDPMRPRLEAAQALGDALRRHLHRLHVHCWHHDLDCCRARSATAKGGQHHVCFEVEDIDGALAELTVERPDEPGLALGVDVLPHQEPERFGELGDLPQSAPAPT